MNKDTVSVPMPPAAKAPAYRQQIALASQFVVEDLAADIVGVTPSEGPGMVRQHLTLVKLADASSDLTDPTLLEPLRLHPARRRNLEDPEGYAQAMEAKAREIRGRVDGAAADIVATALTALGAAETGSLDEFVSAQLPQWFEIFPKGSAWYVHVSDVLLARLAFGRTQFALAMLPDLPVGEDMERLASLEDLTMTRGVHVTTLVKLPLCAMSPAVLGFVVPALPHVVVFCFGDALDLRSNYPQSLASLYRPEALNAPEGLDRPEFVAGGSADDGPLLLEWWTARLNAIYSHATDPTRFAHPTARTYDAGAQTAWLITVERLMADALSLLAEPQATELDRVQIAFDLLDKAEALLGGEMDDGGTIFRTLLRRRTAAPVFRELLGSLPEPVGGRLADELVRLFDLVYEEVRGNAVTYRRTAKAVRVQQPDGTYRSCDDDQYVSRLLRAVRNSSHGLISALSPTGPDRYVLATNTGGVPAAFPALATLIALAILSDIEGVTDGSLLQRLRGNG